MGCPGTPVAEVVALPWGSSSPRLPSPPDRAQAGLLPRRLPKAPTSTPHPPERRWPHLGSCLRLCSLARPHWAAKCPRSSGGEYPPTQPCWSELDGCSRSPGRTGSPQPQPEPLTTPRVVGRAQARPPGRHAKRVSPGSLFFRGVGAATTPSTAPPAHSPPGTGHATGAAVRPARRAAPGLHRVCSDQAGGGGRQLVGMTTPGGCGAAGRRIR